MRCHCFFDQKLSFQKESVLPLFCKGKAYCSIQQGGSVLPLFSKGKAYCSIQQGESVLTLFSKGKACCLYQQGERVLLTLVEVFQCCIYRVLLYDWIGFEKFMKRGISGAAYFHFRKCAQEYAILAHNLILLCPDFILLLH